MGEQSRITTTRRQLARQGELAWGGDGQSWGDAVNTNDGVTVSKDGVQPATGSTIPESGIARWTCNNANSNTNVAVDSWGDYNGAVSNPAYLSNGDRDGSGAYDLNNSNGEYIDFGEITELVGATEFSLSAVMYIRNLEGFNSQLAAHRQNNDGWGTTTGDGTYLSFRVESGGTHGFKVDGAPVDYDQWRRYTFTYNAGLGTVYKDDDYVESNDSGNNIAIPDVSVPFIAGNTKYKTYRESDFILGDLALYAKELSATEVDSLHHTGSITG